MSSSDERGFGRENEAFKGILKRSIEEGKGPISDNTTEQQRIIWVGESLPFFFVGLHWSPNGHPEPQRITKGIH